MHAYACFVDALAFSLLPSAPHPRPHPSPITAVALAHASHLLPSPSHLPPAPAALQVIAKVGSGQHRGVSPNIAAQWAGRLVTSSKLLSRREQRALISLLAELPLGEGCVRLRMRLLCLGCCLCWF